ncbi:unnamed protein product [Blepharisma stoltei]|uniref:Protein kinase domain-containing protein n=1 Tax=Blepharisma stoltei TaxID=1481888 RepID=A0AAU9JY48_9CILI|nr:unnamed protein product [Blepharisma stoltei]
MYLNNSSPVKITIFLNGNLKKKCQLTIQKSSTMSEILSDCKDKLSIDKHTKCRLYDSNGGQLSDDDLEYINPDEPLFLSKGEKFSKSSSLAIYEEIKQLGKGGFGSVFLYRNRITKQEVALKFVELKTILSPEDVNRVFTEIGVLRNLKHPNIVKLIDAFDLHDKVCFVMEYCRGGELKQYLEEKGPLSEREAFLIACQISDAIRYCHNSRVVHRDLKLENILFATEEKEQIKIVDFGISGMFALGGEGDASDAGSLLYIAPEVLSGKDNRTNPALDIWSLGCIFYSLLTKNLPFSGETQREVINRILTCQYPPLPQTISKSWHKLIKGMIRVKPSKRWGMLRISEHLYKYRNNPDAEVSSDSEEETFEEKKIVLKKKPPSRSYPKLVFADKQKRYKTPILRPVEIPRGKKSNSITPGPRRQSPAPQNKVANQAPVLIQRKSILRKPA